MVLIRRFAPSGSLRRAFSFPPLPCGPRRFEPSLPHSAAFGGSFLLRLGIAPLGIARPVERVTSAHHRLVDFPAISTPANGHRTPVAVTIHLSAPCRSRLRKKRIQSLGSYSSTSVFDPACIGACLPGLGRVDRIEPDALATDFQCIAIDHGCPSDNLLRMSGEGEKQGGDQQSHPISLAG